MLAEQKRAVEIRKDLPGIVPDVERNALTLIHRAVNSVTEFFVITMLH